LEHHSNEELDLMKYRIAIIGFALGLALGTASAQTAPEVTLQQSTLAGEAQQNIGTAQLLFKLGQTQGQLAVLQDQAKAKDDAAEKMAAWWKRYVEGTNSLFDTGVVRNKDSGELQAVPEAARH
jgi:hypothetical protein